MSSEKRLRREIKKNFGGRWVRHSGKNAVIVSQSVNFPERRPISGTELQGIAEAVTGISHELSSPDVLKPLYNTVKSGTPDFSSQPEIWMYAVGAFICDNYFDSLDQNRHTENIRHLTKTGIESTLGHLKEAADNPEKVLRFEKEHGRTKDGRKVVSACLVPKDARAIFVAFYEVMKDDVPDPSGNLAKTVQEVRRMLKDA